MHVTPMKAVASGTVPLGDDWITELKWDGGRIQVDVGPDRTELRSGRGTSWTSMFPELAGIADHCAIPAVLDAEVVVFEDGRPSFARLQHRFGVTAPPVELVEAHPTHLVVFELLAADGRSTLDLDYRRRRLLLDQIVTPGPIVSVPPHLEGDGRPWLDLARQRGLEGIVVKRADSRYQPGSRSHDWVKVKVMHRQDFVVLGWLEGRNSLAGRIGSLVVGVRDGDRWRTAGSVGSGLTDTMRSRLADQLRPSSMVWDPEAGPFDRIVHWVEPEVVAEVRFAEWSPEANLRHPVLLGVGLEREPTDVVREPISD